MTSPTGQSPLAIAETLLAVATDAGALALKWFRPGERTSAHTDYKPGGSPVTEADFAVDAFLRERLVALFPHAGWLSEETADSGERLSREDVIVVDPIDGTRGFASGDLRWSVSVALVRAGRPLAGAIVAPASSAHYFAALGEGAWLNGARLAPRPDARLAGGKIAGPQPSSARIASALDMALTPKIPSLAVRFAQVADGALDAALSSANSHDWDIAAADLILHEAGAKLTDFHGRAPIYNRSDLRHGALAAAPAATHPELIAALARAQQQETPASHHSHKAHT